MEKIALIVDRLNQPPFSKGLTTMTEFDSKSSLELLDYMCEIMSSIDPDQVLLINSVIRGEWIFEYYVRILKACIKSQLIWECTESFSSWQLWNSTFLKTKLKIFKDYFSRVCTSWYRFSKSWVDFITDISGDKEILHTVMHWCLQRYDHLKKRAYLSKFLLPTEIPAEFLNDDLVFKIIRFTSAE